jgi:hypothetical protein
LSDYIFKEPNKNNFESISEKINIEIEKSQSMIDEFLKAGKQSRTNFYRERIIELQSYLKKITFSEEMV